MKTKVFIIGIIFLSVCYILCITTIGRKVIITCDGHNTGIMTIEGINSFGIFVKEKIPLSEKTHISRNRFVKIKECGFSVITIGDKK